MDETDPLTGLGLRAAAEAALEAGSQEGSRTYAALFVVERIESINARFGYSPGDRVMNYFLQYLASSLSAADKLYRSSDGSFLALTGAKGIPGSGAQRDGHDSVASAGPDFQFRQPLGDTTRNLFCFFWREYSRSSEEFHDPARRHPESPSNRVVVRDALGLGIAMFTARTYLVATCHRVPRRVRPFDLGVGGHDRPRDNNYCICFNEVVAVPKDTIWPIEPHTAAKHQILRKRAWIVEYCSCLSDPSKLFDADSQLLENSVKQWRTDVAPAVDRDRHGSAVGVDPSFVTTRLAA